MVKEPLYLPGDKQELFDRYLDKTAHADLIERLRVITGALQNKLTPQKLRLHRIDRTDAITLFHERQKLTKKMFQAVVTDFAVSVRTRLKSARCNSMKRLAGKKPSLLRRPEFPTYVTIRSYWNKCTSGGKTFFPARKKALPKPSMMTLTPNGASGTKKKKPSNVLMPAGAACPWKRA